MTPELPSRADDAERKAARATHSLSAKFTQANRDKLRRVMNELDLRTDSDRFVDHFAILLNAQRVYQSRYDKYKDYPIMRMGAIGCLVHMRTNVERMWVQMGSLARNDALDTINYAVHYIRQERNQHGTWWSPGERGTDTDGADIEPRP
jgi:hypothetical protein